MSTGTGELEGAVAIVTGGSRGIGRAIAEALAEGGARVAVIARNAEGAAAAAAELPGEGHLGIGCDVSDGEAVVAMVRRVDEELGPVGILVNNAGITRDNLLLRMKEEDWDAVLDVNLKAAFHTVKAVTKGMMRRRDGVILNVTSVVGLMGNAGQANYAASKAGLVGLTKSVARELAPRGIRCNAVAPGYIRTDMTADLGDAQTEALQSGIPLQRLGDPEDIAGVVRFLAGPSARYITGQVLAVDGGMVM
ncbi:MAG: 3-oxoacyl-[acyl-carrier-protein] reductase [Gemmatimonadetes bacterium]|nr:3-oxoacyl-[acyl-carrier-protein] reductase [Gemmatimonadota bacterium]MBT8402921.1 3-oxoacyl-[acyl-carrier-protein] reductase [Gemmatimonadota bacterium]